MKRLIDCNASDFKGLPSSALKQAIRLSEGRTIVAEVVATLSPLIDKVSNAELAAAFGADLVLLNLYDLRHPQVAGMPAKRAGQADAIIPPRFGQAASGEGQTLADVQRWIGRPVGVNLEPIEGPSGASEAGRLATPENGRLAVQQGAAFIVLTGNPGTGVTSAGIARSAQAIRLEIGEAALLLAGRIHGAGSDGPVVSQGDVEAYVEAGADGVVLPAPGTVPGMTLEACRALVERAHQLGGLAMCAIGTSQEGASRSTVEQIALMSKMAGADLHHIGDSGTIGIAVPENIYTFSLAIRGRRHTWHRMAASSER